MMQLLGLMDKANRTPVKQVFGRVSTSDVSWKTFLAAWDSITSRKINGVWKVTQKEHTCRSGGSEEGGDGAALRVSLG